MAFKVPPVKPPHDPIGHVFDLTVRTYDHSTGTLLWEDFFEQLEGPQVEQDTDAHPQAIPSWSPHGTDSGESYRMALR